MEDGGQPQALALLETRASAFGLRHGPAREELLSLCTGLSLKCALLSQGRFIPQEKPE